MKILLGVTGSIAAYKAVEITSRLKKAGNEVKVIMTANATKFVSKRTFAEISKNAVSVDMFSEPDYKAEHIELASWADLVLIAPATANIIAKIANGIADDTLSTTILATKAPVIICPAMNTNMLSNTATQTNLKTLTQRGIEIIEPATGILACQTVGKGRLPEPAEIVEKILNHQNKKPLPMKLLVTAGATIEPIDPVRYITNHSTGRMGYAIATQAIKRGAEVILISAKAELQPPEGVKFIKAETALEMHDKVLEHFNSVDAVIMTAAVSDYRVKNISTQKIKKSADTLTLELVKNPDILKELGKVKTKQKLIGFAAETENLLENAQRKLREKNLDFIVANNVTQAGAGFAADTNIATFISKTGQVQNLPKMSKLSLADEILNLLIER